MRKQSPTSAATDVLDDHTWHPNNFEALLEEIRYLEALAKCVHEGEGPTLLYRGQSSAKWELNSTFARWFQDHYNPYSFDAYELGTRLLLDHFGNRCAPSAELFKVCAENDGMDPWFELMKRIQQHPESPEFKELHGRGTNLIDWSRSADVGLCFGSDSPDREGALYIFDAQEAGNVLVQTPYRETLDRWQSSLDAGQAPGYPLLFCPPKQHAYQRAKRQHANYLAQFDLRAPIEEVWEAKERETSGGRIYMKLILTPDVKVQLNRVLLERGMVSSP